MYTIPFTVRLKTQRENKTIKDTPSVPGNGGSSLDRVDRHRGETGRGDARWDEKGEQVVTGFGIGVSWGGNGMG